jgi:hypothetical protein
MHQSLKKMLKSIHKKATCDLLEAPGEQTNQSLSLLILRGKIPRYRWLQFTKEMLGSFLKRRKKKAEAK